MALITRIVAEVADGLVSLSYIYEDANMRIQSVRCNNQTQRPALIRVTHTPTGRSLERTVAADTDITYPVPQTANQRLTLRLVDRGDGTQRLNDVDIDLVWPSDA